MTDKTQFEAFHYHKFGWMPYWDNGKYEPTTANSRWIVWQAATQVQEARIEAMRNERAAILETKREQMAGKGAEIARLRAANKVMRDALQNKDGSSV